LKKVTKNKHFLLKVEGGGELTQLPEYTTSTIGFFLFPEKPDLSWSRQFRKFGISYKLE